MSFAVRLLVPMFAFALTLACGSSSEQQAAEPIITTMPMDVSAGTDLILTLETPVSSDTAKPDQPVRATVAKPVIVGGMEVIPVGTAVTGAVVSAERAGRVKGPASVALRFNEVTVLNTAYRIATADIALEAGATKGEEVTIPAGAPLRMTITEAVRIVMPM
jgi:hypothetical protein